MKKTITTMVVIAAIIAFIAVAQPFYTIDEGEQGVIVRLGALVGTVTDAGLHVKIPFIDTVVRYPKRIMAWDGEQKSMPTREKQYIWVDVTARWRINDPKKFYESISTLNSAYSKLAEIIDSEVRTVVAENYLRESVRNSHEMVSNLDDAAEILGVSDDASAEIIGNLPTSNMEQEPIQKGRRELAEEILARSRKMVPEYGIELIDVVTRQIRYSDELTQSVYARMIKERNQIAQAFRSEGEGKKAEWLGKTDNEERSILSDAYKQAESIRGAADAQASKIYADAYNADRNFFEFWRATESYKNTLPRFQKTLTTDMDYFKYLYSPE